MRYLHTMLRVRNLDAALDFYCNKLGLKETRRRGDEKKRYTLVFLAPPGDEKLIEAGKKDGRRATASWPSCARPTSIPSSCCRRVRPSRRRSRGSRCPIRASGNKLPPF